MVVKLLLAAIVVAPVLLLVVQAARGRAQVRSCCAVPADLDARLAGAAEPADPPRAQSGAPTLRA